MDVRIINPFLSATINVLKTMAFTEARPGKPFVKGDRLALGVISAVIELNGQGMGSLALSFDEPCIMDLLGKMLGEPPRQIDSEVADAVGELVNMIAGDGRRILAEEGLTLSASIPRMISGPGHRLAHRFPGPVLGIPFTTGAGGLTVEVCLRPAAGEKNGISRAA